MITANLTPPTARALDAGAADGGQTATDWRWLYRTAGIAAALLAALTVGHAVVYFVAGLPGTVAEWFALFQRNGLLGLLAFELLMVLYAVLSVPVTLALWVALRRGNPSLRAA
jgi:hypothetical protein